MSFTLITSDNLANLASLAVEGPIYSQQSIEKIVPLSNATGTVEHNFTSGSIFFHSSPSANFTANITNVPTTNNKGIAVLLIISQGATPYLPTTLQINGATQTVDWAGGTSPSGESNKKQLVVYSLFRVNNSWVVLGQDASYG